MEREKSSFLKSQKISLSRDCIDLIPELFLGDFICVPILLKRLLPIIYVGIAIAIELSFVILF